MFLRQETIESDSQKHSAILHAVCPASLPLCSLADDDVGQEKKCDDGTRVTIRKKKDQAMELPVGRSTLGFVCNAF